MKPLRVGQIVLVVSTRNEYSRPLIGMCGEVLAFGTFFTRRLDTNETRITTGYKVHLPNTVNAVFCEQSATHGNWMFDREQLMPIDDPDPTLEKETDKELEETR